MRAVLYARVSTKDKAPAADGPDDLKKPKSAARSQDVENQLLQLRTFATQTGWEITQEYIDKVSGSGKVRRPEFERMMEDAAAGRFDVVLFWALDRFSREGALKTLQALNRLTAAGVNWRSFTEQYLDSCGIFREAVLAILAVVAKQERIRISERTIAGLAIARSKGNIGGRKPKPKDEAMIRELRSQGLSFAEIAKQTGVSRSTIDRVVKKWTPKILEKQTLIGLENA